MKELLDHTKLAKNPIWKGFALRFSSESPSKWKFFKERWGFIQLDYSKCKKFWVWEGFACGNEVNKLKDD